MQLRLKVVRGKPQGHCLAFPNGEFMFGRGPECDVRPNSDLVSRQHCLLHITNDAAVIRDLGSRNGTLVNGALVLGERPLSNGDTLQIGPLVLEVLIEPSEKVATQSITDTALINQDSTLQTLGRTGESIVVEEPAPISQGPTHQGDLGESVDAPAVESDR